MSDSNAAKQFERFIEIVAALRNPDGGCPWDLEQTHKTLRPYLIEEAYELLEAIDREDDKEFREELGDVLLQVVLHSQLAAERKAFDIAAVVEAISDKMVRRHPHVFGEKKVDGSAQVLKNWEGIKKQEREAKGKPEAHVSIIDGIPQALPALVRAQRLGEKASRVGFDWSSPEGVWDKVKEETKELEQAMSALSEKIEKACTTAPPARDLKLHSELEGELGDLLFSLCQLGRWLGVSAEDSLRGTVERFISRFHQMEKSSKTALSELNEDQLEALWQQAKVETR